MRSRFSLIPLAVFSTAMSWAALAQGLPSLEQAQAAMFPGATFVASDFTLDENQVAALEKESDATVFHSAVRVWRVSTGGWFFLDQVPGRDDRITYAVGLDAAGAVKAIEILECNQGYCGIGERAWQAEFTGKHFGDPDLRSDAHLISGTTLSSAHVTEGIRRILCTYRNFMSQR